VAYVRRVLAARYGFQLLEVRQSALAAPFAPEGRWGRRGSQGVFEEAVLTHRWRRFVEDPRSEEFQLFGWQSLCGDLSASNAAGASAERIDCRGRAGDCAVEVFRVGVTLRGLRPWPFTG